MKRVEVTHRIIKIGRHAVSVAICALTGMALLGSGTALADTTTTLASNGSSTPPVYNQGTTIGSPPNAGFTGSSSVDFLIQTPSIDALGINTQLNYDTTAGTATWNYATINDNSITLSAGNNITGRTLANGAYVAIYTSNEYFRNNDEDNFNYSYFGPSTVLNVQGNNTVNGQVGYNYTNWGNPTTGRNDMLGTINLNGYNVRFGDAVLAENTNINSGTNNTSNNDYSFYGSLYSNLNFNQSASILLNGGLHALNDSNNSLLPTDPNYQSTSGNLNYNGYNSVVTLGANQNIGGNITTTGVNGTLIFQSGGTVVGTIGTNNSSLEEMRLNGPGVVNLTGLAAVDLINYQAAAVLTASGGLNLSVDTSSDGKNQVAFNNHDGLLQIGSGSSLIGLAGQDVLTTTGNGLGTLTMVGGTQSVVGNIGAQNHTVKKLNIGGENTGYIDTSVNNYSVTTVTGDVYAVSTVLNNDVQNSHSSELRIDSGYNLNTTLTTADANMGILTMVGGTQSVKGQVGADLVRLSTVNAGANGAITSFDSAVYANQVNVTGTGTVNFLENVFNNNLNYAANGTAKFAVGKTLTGNVTTSANGNGVLTMEGGTQTVVGSVGTNANALNTVNAGADGAVTNFSNVAKVYTNQLNVTGSGEVNLAGGLYGNLNFTDGVAGANGQANFAVGTSLEGNATAVLNNTGILNMLGGAQTVTGTVGATNLGLNTINANAAGASTTFKDNVFATTINTAGTGGTTTFEKSVTGTTTNIGSGTANFNTTGGNTSSNIVFTGAGTANLYAGLTGNIAVADLAAVVNVWNNQTITGAVSSPNANHGTLSFRGNGSVTGDVTHIDTVNVGTVATGTVTAGGHVDVRTVSIANDSTFLMATDKNLTTLAGVTTTGNNTGTLTMQGGTQTVTGTVGASGALLKVINANAASASTTFKDNVFATTINTAGTDGVTTFEKSVTATTTNMGSGTTNFNTVGGSTASNIVFTDAGTANLHQGLTGNIDVADHSANVNVWTDKTITGTVSSTTPDHGNLTFRGNGTVTGDVTNMDTVNVGSLALGTVTAEGNVDVRTVAIANDSILQMAAGKNLTTTDGVTTSTNNTGTLTMQGDAQSVTGLVGTDSKALKTVNAGVSGATTTFNDMVYATTLKFTGNGTVVLNGTAVANAGAADALKGTADLNSRTGTLQIGSNVDLTTGSSGIQFANANAATLQFNGSSKVTNDLGTAGNTNNGNFNVIKTTGNNATTVELTGNTYLAGANGRLEFAADSKVTVANGKSIVGDAGQTAAVRTTANNQGTLSFLGNTTLSSDIGVNGTELKAVNFHSDGTVAAVSQNLNHNVYAVTTTVGNATTATTANITATGKYLGQNLTLAANNVTLNTAGTVTVTGNAVDFAHTKNANGTLTNTALITQSSTGTGAITTNGATLNFAVATEGWSANNGGGLVSTTAANSSKISAAAGSSLVMNGNEKVNLSLLGSLKNGVTYKLIDVSAASGAQTGTVRDNSFTIDTSLSRGSDGDLVLTSTRDLNTYVTKSDTAGHFSNNAAKVLAGLGAAGAGYSQDMQTVFNKIDIDQWGYGNNQANLATQVKRLAPVANVSVGQSLFYTQDMTINSVTNRLAGLRGDVQLQKTGDVADPSQVDSFWVKGFTASSDQNAQGQYDGYNSSVNGVTLGLDHRFDEQTVAGLALTYADTKVKQQDFRLGDNNSAKTYQVTGYLSYDIDRDMYVDGALSFANNQMTGNRLTALDRMALSDFDGSQVTGRLGLGYRIQLEDKAVLTPLAALELSRLRTDAYQETGAESLNLKVNAQTLSRNRLGLGLRYTNEVETESGVFRPEVTAMVYRDAGLTGKEVTATYVGGGSSFATPLADVSRTGFNLGVGFSLATGKDSSISFRYDLDTAKGAQSNAGQVAAHWAF